MALIGLLILFPMVVAAVLLAVRNDQVRNWIVVIAALVIGLGSISVAFLYRGSQGVFFPFGPHVLDYVCTAIGVSVAGCVFYYAVKYRRPKVCVLAGVQALCSVVLQFGFASTITVPYGLYLDSLSLLMALIIGVVGGGICVFAIGYMRDYHAAHPDEADRRPRFFALMFLLTGAMFGVVFSNNMHWLFSSWEITTFCSFLLIGYARTEEVLAHAFRQVTFNMMGGIAFLVALMVICINLGSLSFVDFLAAGAHNPALVALPVTALAFAGLVKSAQMPFHTWLLGAMVAPTPTSALLHSSTMVKAGVFMLIKLAPLLVVSLAGTMVILIGGITFVLCSFMAISQTNAKRLLAYSTIANLGLIAACAGVGTPEAVWAACFLVLFHAVAKSLLFLCVGTAEHRLGSRDIEDMDVLFERMPRLARFMMLGIMCMFMAPFGMLVAKWATLVSFAQTHQVVLIVLLAFGSAATFLFWAKWLGKLSGCAARPRNEETTVHASEWVAIMVMAVLVILCCIGLPLLSWVFVEPYVYSVFGRLGQDISSSNLWLTSLLSALVVVVLFAGLGGSKTKQVDVYLSGVGRNNDERTFTNAFSGESIASARNWYLEDMFGEARFTPVGTAICALIILVAFAAAAVTLPGLF